MGRSLTPKERMFTALLGQKPDVLPAAPCYLSLYLADSARAHYIEQYRRRMGTRLRYQVDHAEDTHFRAQALYQAYNIFRTKPDWMEVGTGASKAWAERTEIVLHHDVLCYEDKNSGTCIPMHTIPLPTGDSQLSDLNSSSPDIWDLSAQINSQADVDTRLWILRAEELLARGDFDLPRQVVADYGDQYFISTILDTPFSDSYEVLGFRGLMVYQRRNPELLEYLLQRKLNQTKEVMGAYSETGIHGVFVEEVFTGADIISPQSYDRFVFSYNLPYFQHMRGLDLLPIHYVCGDVIPRLHRMVEYDVAAIAVEESKKKFRIEIEEVVERVAGRTAVFGNIDTVQFGIHSSPEEMSAEVERQARVGEKVRGFIVGTGSPFPLETNPNLIDTLIAASHSFATQAPEAFAS